MEKTILTYLEFSLPIHNCVIIPDFGGFILNMEPAVFLSNGEINPPKNSIVFNPELNHNDGIIASYISKNENISYNAACKRIKEFVATIKMGLKDGKTVPFGNLGSFTSDNGGNIIFVQNIMIIHPGLFGLYPMGIKQLAEIDKITFRNKRNLSLKYTIGAIAASVAAITLFMTPVSIKDSNNKNSQKADFISTITSSLSHYQDKEVENVSNQAYSTEQTGNTTEENPARPKSGRLYYIIVGGEDTMDRANNLLAKIKNNGFNKANIVEGGDRYRIYVSSFDDKTEAESFLDTFRKENPKFESAWLYSKRNN
ncbi:HU domain-containing protein [Dysgonomonas termitidis]|uniref:SPOR domain-containing protein n=1 Tax=Dysgonomonas termitidis TaxID=1516126 RepID=A0ABV9L0M0_9BACT